MLSLNENINQFAMANSVHWVWSSVKEGGWSCFGKSIIL